jgi:hypothetical protein
MRVSIGRKALERNAASSATVVRLETEILAAECDLEALDTINGAWVKREIGVRRRVAGPAGTIVERYKDTDKKLYFRGDAAFASPGIYEYLEGEGILYFHPGLQPGQLLKARYTSEGSVVLVTAQYPAQAGQDRGPGHLPPLADRLPVGGGGGIGDIIH